MKLFFNEIKRILNVRLLLIISFMGIIVWFALLNDVLQAYDSLTSNGIYGTYQIELFERYGSTLEEDERNDFDIPGKKTALLLELDEMILNNSLFQEKNIENFESYQDFLTASVMEGQSEQEIEAQELLVNQMQNILSNQAQTIEEWNASPLVKLQTLESLEQTYVNYEDWLKYLALDESPIVAQSAKTAIQNQNNNLARIDLTESFSYYALTVSIFSMIALLVLLIPYVMGSRVGEIFAVQYSSATGRKIFAVQWLTVVAYSMLFSVVLVVLAYLPYLFNGGFNYWYASIFGLHLDSTGLQLYDQTFGQYVMTLAVIAIALNLCLANVLFILARFSRNIMLLLMKSVPLLLAIAGVASLSMLNLFSNQNHLFRLLLNGRIKYVEVIVSLLLVLISSILVGILINREQQVDIL